MNNIFRKYEKPLHGGVLLPHLIHLRGHKCECCHNTEWLGQPINLEVHHIDGDKTNNELDNLQLLCKNCHSYTDNYGTKNIKHKHVTDQELIAALKTSPSIREALLSLSMSDAGGNYQRARKLINEHHIVMPIAIKERYCPDCGKAISAEGNYCPECAAIHQRRAIRPTKEELLNLIQTTPFVKIGELYGVTDNAVRKWCKVYGLPFRKKDIKN